MKQKKALSWMSIFVMMLVISLPICSSSALAATVQITKNSGEDGIYGYLDATGDVWNVEALISGAEVVNPENLRIEVGRSSAQFQSCTESAEGMRCEYISPLTDGVQENEHAFRVVYDVGGLESANSDVIKADGSPPLISSLNVVQSGGDVELDFVVSDRYEGKPSVGIKLIEILDGDSGEVLQVIDFAEQGEDDFDYFADGGFEGKLQATFTGEGMRRIKIRATDWLGHQATGFPYPYNSDFIKPVIGEINFSSLGKFIGEKVVLSDLRVGVTEKSQLNSVRAYSSQTSLDGEEAVCDEIDDALWDCVWYDVEVHPESSIVVKIVAEDQYGNVVEKTLTETLTVDLSKPVMEFFGSERVFDGISYVKSGQQKVILKVSEQGAGMSTDGILADLKVLGESGFTGPTACSDDGLECYWLTSQTFTSAGAARILLSKFEDRAGNQGESREVEMTVDTIGPVVDKIEIYGGEKNYFQSNDPLVVEMEVYESAGLFVMVDVNDLVMGAEEQFPADYVFAGMPAKDGWQVFTEEDCVSSEGKWKCSFSTAPIRSGPDNGVNLEVVVTDTAGNLADKWNTEPANVNSGSGGVYRVDILGLENEENPDYWEVSRGYPKTVKKFVDLDTVQLGYTNMPLEVRLKSDNSRANAMKVDLVGCVVPEEGAPELGRVLMHGGNYPDGTQIPKPMLILEFVPFDGKEFFGITGEEKEFKNVMAEYTCQVQIYSRVGNTAIQKAELEEFTVSVPFAFSELGAQDENLAKLIQDAKDEADSGFWGVIGTLENIMKWLYYISNILNIVNNVAEIIVAAQEGVTTPVKTTDIAICFGLNSALDVSDAGISIFRNIAAFFACSPDTGIPWYDDWIGWIPGYYNQLMDIELLQEPGHCADTAGSESCAAKPARSVRDNLYLSAVSLCIPGLVHNLDKYRQIKC
ncbi:MAG: hypothetical protein KKH52_03695, partial [Nanoarchaeota archaeon]|nr:hypothetical protein [Nanoarchaeota archaeon]